MATYLAHDALRLPAASLLANSGLCVNIEFEISLLLGVNVATTYKISKVQIYIGKTALLLEKKYYSFTFHFVTKRRVTMKWLKRCYGRNRGIVNIVT